MQDELTILRDALDDVLEMLQQKIRRGRLTLSDFRSIFNALAEGGGISATISDLAEFYGTSEVNVRSVIKRRAVGEPQRRVYYDFLKFNRQAPSSWHRRRSKSSTSD